MKAIPRMELQGGPHQGVKGQGHTNTLAQEETIPGTVPKSRHIAYHKTLLNIKNKIN